MNNSPIAWFEIVVQNFDRGCQFYSKAFDMTLTTMKIDNIDMALFPYQDGYTGGALVASPNYDDHVAGPNTSIIYLNCDSVTKQLSKIISLGGKEVFPTTKIGENGYIAGFEDSEGNHIGIWSEVE